jgi:aminopeptidase N
MGNQKPVAPREVQSAQEIYDGHDIYFKGAWVLHTLRWLVGDDAFFRSLRRMAYPDSALAASTDGRGVRFVATRDFETIAARESGRDLTWFFDAYVRQAPLPNLVTARTGDMLTLRWEVPGGLPFPMPVEVRVGGKPQRMDLPSGGATLRVPAQATVEIDPLGWLLLS